MPSGGIAELAFAIQPAKGSPAAAATHRVYLAGGQLPRAEKPLQDSTGASTQRLPLSGHVDYFRVVGQPELHLRPEFIGTLLYAALGAKTLTPADLIAANSFNPGFELADLSKWYSAGTTNTLTRVATVPRRGGWALELQRTPASGTGFVRALSTPAIAASAGTTYTVTGFVRSQVARGFRALIAFYDAGGSNIGETPAVSSPSSGGWTRLTASGAAPALTTGLRAGIYTYNADVPEGELHWIDDVAVFAGVDPWTHVFTPALTQPWLTFWRSIGGILNERFVDCKVSVLTIASQAGRPIRVTFGILGISPRYQASQMTTIAVEVGMPFRHSDGKGSLQVEGAAVAAIDEWSIVIDPGTAHRQSLAGTDVRTGPRMRVAARVGQSIADATLWKRFAYGTSAPADDDSVIRPPLDLEASGGLSLKALLASGPERSLKIDIPRVVLKDVDGIEADENGKPIRAIASYETYKPAAGAAITATLLNGVSGY